MYLSICELVCGGDINCLQDAFIVLLYVKSDLEHISMCVFCVMQVQGFFSGLKERGSQMRTVKEALETIRLNRRWIDKNLSKLQKWL